MKKLMLAVLAGFMSVAFSAGYASDKKSDTGMTKSEKGMAKKHDAMSNDAMSKDDMKKKKKGKKKGDKK